MIGKELKELREKAGLLQEELGALVGLSRFTVINHESGHTKISNATARMYESVLKDSTFQENLGKDIKSSKKPVLLNEAQNSHINLITASTSSASLELLCEVLSAVTQEPLDSVKARARALTVVKSRNVEKFLKTMI